METILRNRALKWLPILFLLAISAVAYLPFIRQIGFMNDDWYLIFAGKAQGSGVFSTVFAIDRPLRAYVMGPAYNLFGDNALLYQISAYFIRFLSGVCVLWLMQMLRPKHGSSNLLTAVFFLIYPGFLSQVNAIDYQSHIAAIFLAMLSIALTIKAISTSGWVKVLLFLGSIITGWVYLGLMEYFIGLEAFRIICVYLLNENKTSPGERLISTIKQWAPSALAPVGFLFWRLFIFDSERKATNLGAQLQEIMQSPTVKGAWMAVSLWYDTLKAGFLGWGVPVYIINANLRLRDHLFILVAATVIITALVWMGKYIKDDEDEETQSQSTFIFYGLAVVILALLPVVLVNRYVNFESYSRYTLPASIGSAMILAGVTYSITNKSVRTLFYSFFILIAIITHYMNGARMAAQTASIREFWWQVSWRVPEFQPGTTLVADYPISAIEEDYFVWGPANLIYNPASTDSEILKPMISAIVLNDGNLLDIMRGGELKPIQRRGILTKPDVEKILVLSQPTQLSCMHVIDGNDPIISTFEEPKIKSAANYSNIDLINMDAKTHTPPTSIFGAEPEHGWCYYFQKASLASQSGDWNHTARLGNQAWDQGLRPDDKSEWLIFLKAYINLDQFDEVEKIAKDIKKDDFQKFQACQSLATEFGNSNITPRMKELIDIIFCAE